MVRMAVSEVSYLGSIRISILVIIALLLGGYSLLRPKNPFTLIDLENEVAPQVLKWILEADWTESRLFK